MKPIRVLQVVSKMDRGGVETWLLHVLRNANRDRLQMDFLVNSTTPGHYDEEIRSLGSKVLACPSRSRPVAFARNFFRILRAHGPYDVVHSHVQHYAGYVLCLARAAGIKVRIAHSHNTQGTEGASLLRRIYLRAQAHCIDRYATKGLAVSEMAGESLFGPRWRADKRWRVFHCGIDLAPFRATPDVDAARSELGLPQGAFVVGHVGRFDPAKNHSFLLRIAAAVCRQEPRAHFVLVGDGPLRRAMEALAQQTGLTDRITFAGSRGDVPRLLRTFDAFLFPSHREGLPLAVVEAQAAGVPVVLSDTVTREVAVVPALLHWLRLTDPPEHWGAAVIYAFRQPRPDRLSSLALVEDSDFNLDRSLALLESEYFA